MPGLRACVDAVEMAHEQGQFGRLHVQGELSFDSSVNLVRNQHHLMSECVPQPGVKNHANHDHD